MTTRRGVRAPREQLLTLINGWDPVGKLESGAPRDSYETLVDRLLEVLASDAGRDDVEEFLEREVTQSFGARPKDVAAFANRAVTWFRMASSDQGA